MSLIWIKNWKSDLLGSINFQQLSANRKGFFSLLRDYVRDDKWCGGLCLPNGKPITIWELSELLKGRYEVMKRDIEVLLENGMLYYDKNKILCLRKYAYKVLINEAQCKKLECIHWIKGKCTKLDDTPDLPLKLPCINSTSTTELTTELTTEGTTPLATDSTTDPKIQLSDDKEVITISSYRREADENKINKDDKEGALRSTDSVDRTSLDLAQTLWVNCRDGKLEWAKDTFYSALKRGIKAKDIEKIITQNPGVVAKDIIKLMVGQGINQEPKTVRCPDCKGTGKNPEGDGKCIYCDGKKTARFLNRQRVN